MDRKQLSFEDGFDVVAGDDRSQAATMVLAPGTSTGGPDNKHPRSDQWLYVCSGEGRAIVAGEELDLAPQTLLLIEQGETHEVRNTGREPLVTLNFYVPPVY